MQVVGVPSGQTNTAKGGYPPRALVAGGRNSSIFENDRTPMQAPLNSSGYKPSAGSGVNARTRYPAET